MFRRSVVAWIVNLCPLLRRSQAKASAAISWGAMKRRRVSQADLGRAMETDTVAKYSIKRVSRFVRNNRVDMAEGCRGLVALAAKAAGLCLVVAVDRVDSLLVLRRERLEHRREGGGTHDWSLFSTTHPAWREIRER